MRLAGGREKQGWFGDSVQIERLGFRYLVTQASPGGSDLGEEGVRRGSANHRTEGLSDRLIEGLEPHHSTSTSPSILILKK